MSAPSMASAHIAAPLHTVGVRMWLASAERNATEKNKAVDSIMNARDQKT